jgi:hypothetical protein
VHDGDGGCRKGVVHMSSVAFICVIRGLYF